MKNLIFVLLFCTQLFAGISISPAPGSGGGGSGNIESINADETAAQTISVGTSGTDFAIVDDAAGGHVLNLPSASATARGLVTTGAQTIAGAKTLSSAPILSALTASTVPYLDASKVLTSSAVTPTELGYVSGVSSSIQTQLGTKAPSASPTFSGTITTPLTASRILTTNASSELAASSVTTTTLGFLDATSSIQTQLNAKAPSASPTFSGTITTPLTASRVLTTNGSSELAASSITTTTLGFLDATSSIQTQLDAKQGLDTQLTSLAGLSYGSNALKVVRVNAGETDFELATLSASGDFVGPGSSTDNAVVRFDSTTGKLGQNSSVIIGDNGDITSTVTGASVGLTISNGSQTTDIVNFKDNTSIVDQWLDQGRRVTSMDNYTGNSTGWTINATAPASPSGSIVSGVDLNLAGSLPDTAGTITGLRLTGSNSTTNSNGTRRMLSITPTGNLAGSGTSATFSSIYIDNNNGAFPATPSPSSGLGNWLVNGLNRASNSSAGKGSGGILARTYGGNLMYALAGVADQTNGSSAKAHGVFGAATTDTTDFSGSVTGAGGVVAVLGPTGNSTLFNYAVAAKAALIADNTTSTEAIIKGLDAGTVAFEVADGGIVTLGATSTTPKHVINGTTAAASNCGSAAAECWEVTFDGNTRYIPMY